MIAAATLFSGIGAPETSMSDWAWLWSAEIERFPSAVLAHRHSTTVNLGDVNAEDFCERASRIGVPDVLVFGSPCQDFSVAGLRLGLDGARGNMALIALGIARQLRPRWLVFENVPGLFSSFSGSAEAEGEIHRRIADEGGRCLGESTSGDEDSDFAAFLSAVRECGYLGVWRVFDAQHSGVPQRRRRVFFVGYLGDWRPAAAVLLEPESLRGDSPPRRAPGQGFAADLAPSLTASGRGVERSGDTRGQDPIVAVPMLANPLTARMAKGVNTTMDEGQTMIPVAFDCKAGGETGFAIGNVAGALRGDGSGGGHSAVLAFSCKDQGNDVTENISPPLRAMNFDGSHANAGGQLAIAFKPSHYTRDKDGVP